MNCPNCGAPIDPDANFCNACGTQLSNESNNNTEGTSSFNNTPFFTPETAASISAKPVKIQSRNIATCIILSIITCGLYGIYWFISMVNDINEASENGGPSGAVVFLLSLVTCSIYRWYYMYKAGRDITTAQKMRGIDTDSNSGIVYLILSVVGLDIVSWALIQNELNKLAEEFGE